MSTMENIRLIVRAPFRFLLYIEGTFNIARIEEQIDP